MAAVSSPSVMPQAWRARVQDRAGEAADHFRRACLQLGRAVRVIEGDRPMRAADGDDARARAMTAEHDLADAASNLYDATSLMSVAEDVALRGAARNPAVPLLSVDSIAGVDEPARKLRSALEQLRAARVHADSALVSIHGGRVHLSVACELLDHERLPGVDGIVDQERVAAGKDVSAALERAEQSLLLARDGCGFLG